MTEQSRCYVYFRFYTADDDIADVLEKFCGVRWRPFTPAGYNVKEYQCETDNVGGLSVDVATLHGYVLPHRETGFIDSAPSSDLVDLTMKMAAYQTRFENLRELDLLANDNLIIRKTVVSNSSGDGRLNVNLGEQAIDHPFYFTLDSSVIEVLEKTGVITDNSSNADVVALTIDHDNWIPPLTYYASNAATNPGNVYDKDWASYGVGSGTVGTVPWWSAAHAGEPIHIERIITRFHLSNMQTFSIEISDDGTNWTEIYTFTDVSATYDKVITGSWDMSYIRCCCSFQDNRVYTLQIS